MFEGRRGGDTAGEPDPSSAAGRMFPELDPPPVLPPPPVDPTAIGPALAARLAAADPGGVPGEQLAGLISDAEQLAGWAHARQLAVIATLDQRPEYQGEPDDPTRRHGGHEAPADGKEFVREEITSAAHISISEAERRLAAARLLPERLASSWEAFCLGRLSLRHAIAMAEEIAPIADDQLRHQVECRLLARHADKPPWQLARAASRAIASLLAARSRWQARQFAREPLGSMTPGAAPGVAPGEAAQTAPEWPAQASPEGASGPTADAADDADEPTGAVMPAPATDRTTGSLPPLLDPMLSPPGFAGPAPAVPELHIYPPEDWDPSGLATLCARMTVEDAATLTDTLNTHTPPFDPADPTPVDTRRLHTLIDLVSGALSTDAGSAYATTAAGEPDARSGRAGRPRRRRSRRPELHVLVGLDTLLDGERPGRVPDLGLLPADAVHRISCDATLRALLTQPATGQLVELGRATPTIPAPLRRHVTGRDRRCQFPGCARPARGCEVHHVIWWSRGGRTDRSNLITVCARHHHACHEGGWRLVTNPDGGHTWTSPTGQAHHTRPPDQRDYLDTG